MAVSIPSCRTWASAAVRSARGCGYRKGKPHRTVVRPRCWRNRSTAGNDPPERIKAGATLKTRRQASGGKLTAGCMRLISVGSAAAVILVATRTPGGVMRTRCSRNRRAMSPGVLTRDQTETQFCDGMRCNHRLGTRSAIAAYQAVDIHGRAKGGSLARDSLLAEAAMAGLGLGEELAVAG